MYTVEELQRQSEAELAGDMTKEASA